MLDNSFLLLVETLLNIAVLFAQREASLWHDRIPSHSSLLAASMLKNIYLLENMEKIDTLLLRINTILTQLKVRPGSRPLRIVVRYVDESTRSMMAVFISNWSSALAPLQPLLPAGTSSRW